MLHYGGVLIAVVCATVGYTFVYVPAVKGIDDVAIQINELSLSVQNAPVIHEQHRIVSTKLRELKSRIAATHARVPPDADAGDFLKELTQIAHEEQLSIKNFKPEKPLRASGYIEMEVALTGEGSFTSICTFFERLNRLARLSKVKHLTISTSPEPTDYPLEATLVIYFGLRGDDAEPPKEVRRG